MSGLPSAFEKPTVHVPKLVPVLVSHVADILGWLKVEVVPGSSQTLRIGDRAPEFTLAAANRSEVYSLPQVLVRGPVILEFLRGTW
jgi:hypothetical protein